MNLVFNEKNGIKIDMKKYVQEMIDEYPDDLKGTSKTPANEKLFKVNDKSNKLSKDEAEVFHTMVAKGLFLSKRSRPDIQMTIAFLCTRVREPTMEDWGKLHRVMDYLKKT